MNTSNIAQAVKDYIVDLAVNDNLPMDLTQLSITELKNVISGVIPIDVGGFVVGDVEHTINDVNDNRGADGLSLIANTPENIDDIMDLMDKRFDASFGMSWDVIEDAILDIAKDEFKGYDLYLDGKDKDTFVGGMGGFVYVDKDRVPDVTFQCDIDEFGEEDGMMYGLESVMVKNNITFEYPIKDVSEGQSYMMGHELREPYRSAFVYHWLVRNNGEIVDNDEVLSNSFKYAFDDKGIVETGWGKVDVDKIKKAFEFYNQKTK